MEAANFQDGSMIEPDIYHKARIQAGRYMYFSVVKRAFKLMVEEKDLTEQEAREKFNYTMAEYDNDVSKGFYDLEHYDHVYLMEAGW